MIANFLISLFVFLKQIVWKGMNKLSEKRKATIWLSPYWKQVYSPYFPFSPDPIFRRGFLRR